MNNFIARYPLWSLIFILLAAAFLCLVLAPWPPELVASWGRKQIFLNALLGGITLGALYFLVASGFTLIFGLMRNVNLAHGSLLPVRRIFRLRGRDRLGFAGCWPFRSCSSSSRCSGIVMQFFIFSLMEGRGAAPDAGHHRAFDHPCRPHALAVGRRQSYSILAPQFLQGPMELPLVSSVNARPARSPGCATRRARRDPGRGNRDRRR